MRKIRMMKPRKFRHEEGFHAMKKCSLIFNGLLVVQAGNSRMDPTRPERQILQDISLVMIMLGLLVAVLNLVLHSLVRTEHIFFLTLAILFVIFMVCCEVLFLVRPELIAKLMLHKNMFMDSYSKDDITFDEEARIVFPTSKIGIRWAFMQFAFKCCGFSGPQDYDRMIEADMKLARGDGKLEQMRLPLSCCKFDSNFKFFTNHVVPMNQIKRCLINDPSAFYEQGCFGINWKHMNLMNYLFAIVVIVTIITHKMTPAKLKEDSENLKVDQMTSNEFYIDKNARFHLHETLIRDFVRTEAFQLAFNANKHLLKDKNVLEVGSGAALLSMFACKAGAKKVLSIEESKINQIAEEVIKSNNCQKVISIIDKKVEDIDILPFDSDKADVIICDWIGYCLLHDSTLPSLITARDKFLKPGGCILPDVACIYVTGLEDFTHVMQSEHWWGNVWGFDMSCMMEASLTEPRIKFVDPESIVTESYMVLEVDANVASASQVFTSLPFHLSATRTATIHAIVVYFDVCFSKCHTYVGFSTSPGSPYTHYEQTSFYLRHPLVVNQGEKVNGVITFKPNPQRKNGLLIDLDIEFSGVYCNVNDTMKYCITF